MLQVLPSFQFVFLSDEITGYKFRLCYNWHAIFYLMNILKINENLYNFLCFNSMHFLRRLKPFHLTYISRFCPLNGLYTNFVGFFFLHRKENNNNYNNNKNRKTKSMIKLSLFFIHLCIRTKTSHTFQYRRFAFPSLIFPRVFIILWYEIPVQELYKAMLFFSLAFIHSFTQSLTHSLTLPVRRGRRQIYFF